MHTQHGVVWFLTYGYSFGMYTMYVYSVLQHVHALLGKLRISALFDDGERQLPASWWTFFIDRVCTQQPIIYGIGYLAKSSSNVTSSIVLFFTGC